MQTQRSFESQLSQIEKRRFQLWSLAFILIICFAAAVMILSFWGENIPKVFQEYANFNIIRISLVILSVAFCVYVAEREAILKKLGRRLFEEKLKSLKLHRKVDEVQALLQAGTAVNSVLEVDKVLDVILEAAFELLGASQGSIMLINEKTNLIEIVNARGLSKEIMAKARIKIGESISGWVAQKGKPLLLTGDVNANKYKNFSKKARFIRSAIVVPLKVKNKSIGVLSLSVGDKDKKQFDKYDLDTAQVFAGQVAMAISNAKLFEQTTKSRKKLESLNVKLADKNDELKKANSDLKKVNDELEKFNNITVDRELQMIKLKEEIRRLETRLQS